MATDTQRRTFISYSRINEAFAVKLAVELKSAGYSVWLDQLDIPTGARWDDEIEKALRECGIFLAVLTPAFIASENAKDEIGYAIDHGKRILPVLLQECEIPFRLRRFQYIDFTKMNYGEGVKHAKEMLAKLIKEESIPRPANIPKDEASIISEIGLARGEEKPTQSTSSRLSQSISDHTNIPPEIAGKLRKSPFQRSSMLFGIILFAILTLVAGISLGPKLYPSTMQTPTSAPTLEIMPTDTSLPTKVANTITPTPAPQRFFTEEFDQNVFWNENWALDIKSKNKKDIQFSINNGEANWELNNEFLWVDYLYRPYSYTSVRLDLEFKNLKLMNTDIEKSSLSLICGYNDADWYEFNINGGMFRIVRRDANRMVINDPRDGSLKKLYLGNDAVNTVTVICNNKEISISANGVGPPTYKFVYGDADHIDGQIGIALTSDKGFPASVQILSIKVSEP